LYGGTLENVKVETLHLGEHTKSFTCIDMPSIEMTMVWEMLPELTNLHIQNCDLFTQANFVSMYKRLTTYKGLKILCLELLSFDIEDVRSEYVQILQTHSDSLTHISLARNKVSNTFLQDVFQVFLKSLPSLQQIDLRHLKETSKIDWPLMLGSIATIASKERSKPIKVIISDYQT